VAKSNLLSVLKLKKLRRAGRHADGGGLYLQISKWDTKAWLFRYERDGRERQMGLGPIDLVSLAEARDRAWAARRLLLDGRDPIEARRDERAARLAAAAKHVSFEQCARQYIKAHALGWRNAKHVAQWTSTLEAYAFPAFGAVPVADVDTAFILKALQPIWEKKTETANRVRSRIAKILDWAKVSGYRSGDNPARWVGHLDQLLPRKSKVAPVKHHPAMPYGELPKFLDDLRPRRGISARALEFLILTAARTGEVIEMRCKEIDFGAKVWTVPSERMKSGREHRVPLSERAMQLVSDARELNGEAFVFAGEGGRSLSDMAMLELLRDMRPGLTVHGFRSTFKDWVSETTKHENMVSEMALAHAVGDATEAAYRRGDLFIKRTRLMSDWAVFCARRPSRERVVIGLSGERRAKAEVA
jgi:integrase